MPSQQEKEPIQFAIDATIENFRRGGCEQLTIRIDREAAITSLFLAIQEMCLEETQPEAYLSYSSSLLGTVENENKEVKGLIRTCAVYLGEEADSRITPASPRPPWRAQHVARVINHYMVHFDGRMACVHIKGRDRSGRIVILAECERCKVTKVERLGSTPPRWVTDVWLGRSNHRDENFLGTSEDIVLARPVRRKTEKKRDNSTRLERLRPGSPL